VLTVDVWSQYLVARQSHAVSSMKAVHMKPLWNSSEYHMAVCMVHQQLTTNCATEIHGKAKRKNVMQLHAGIQVAESIQMGSSNVIRSFGVRVVAAAAQGVLCGYICQLVCQRDMHLMPMGTVCNCLYASVKNVLNPFTAASFI
jgi:hypothetical protein